MRAVAAYCKTSAVEEPASVPKDKNTLMNIEVNVNVLKTKVLVLDLVISLACPILPL